MKIIFMGTPRFAVPALEALLSSGHEIPLVFTQPDKPRGRGQKVRFSPVKEFSRAHGIRVHQPLSLRKGDDAAESLALIREAAPDIIIVAAYGQILPRDILDLPRLGCVNIHASLLPRWRGASPINYCIMNGDKESGITIMQMETGIDTGDMFLRESCAISDTMTAAELHDILSEMGARLIAEFMEKPEHYIGYKTMQDHSLATHAPLITKEMKRINRNKSALELHNFIRGFAGEAYTLLDEKRLKVFASECVLYGAVPSKLDIICGDGKALRLLEVQIEGKSKMSAEDFLRGYTGEFIWTI
jgi:methionyl-tRNA formyltransferase